VNRPLKTLLLAASCAVSGLVLTAPVHADDQAPKTPAQPAKDPVCQATAKPGVDCHSPGSRAAVLKTYLAEQGKLAASQTGTNAVKDCDKPPSKAALMQKAAPAAK
jgi:hypothetical protein